MFLLHLNILTYLSKRIHVYNLKTINETRNIFLIKQHETSIWYTLLMLKQKTKLLGL